jgi:hypothetical protein
MFHLAASGRQVPQIDCMQNPQDMGDDQLKAQIQAVIERMMLAGWIRESAHSRGITASELTADGKIAARLLRKLLAHPNDISPADFACFLGLLKSLPPETIEESRG